MKSKYFGWALIATGLPLCIPSYLWMLGKDIAWVEQRGGFGLIVGVFVIVIGVASVLNDQS